jgi:hypothetical protein
MTFCLGATVGRRIGDPYLMRHLAAKSADIMLVILPHYFCFLKRLFYTHLFSRESKRCLITCAPTPPPAFVMIHLFDPLGK